MRDPMPENIDGSKVQRHEFKHVINWGYVSVALAALVVAYLILRSMDGPVDEDDETATYGQ